MNKAVGTKAALNELELSANNVVAVGDAENDHAFLRACGCSAAVANALPILQYIVPATTPVLANSLCTSPPSLCRCHSFRAALVVHRELIFQLERGRGCAGGAPAHNRCTRGDGRLSADGRGLARRANDGGSAMWNTVSLPRLDDR